MSSLNLAKATRTGTRGPSSITAADPNVAYISLQSETYPAGTSAVVTNPRTGATVTTAMIDGGMDPVPIPASAGDSVSIDVQTAAGITIATVNNFVPIRRAPTILRTGPGRGRTGVPLNKNIVIVFTEPVNPASLASSIRVVHGNSEIAGTATILQGATAAVVFTPTGKYAPNTNYELVVTNGVRDLDGDALDSTVRIPFSTGASVEGAVASVGIVPEGAEIRVGDQFQAVVVVRDAGGNEITGHGVKWSADSTAAPVTSTGLVSGGHEGYGVISAEVDGVMGFLGVRVTNALAPVASVVVAFDSGSVAPGGALQVAVIAFDADGNLLPRRLVQWGTTNAAVATVAPIGQPTPPDVSRVWFNGYVPPPEAIYWANVTGVANGVARIVATIDGRSDTAVVTVAGSLPAVGFFVLPDTSTLLLHQTAQSEGFSINSAGGRTAIPAGQIQWESSNPDVASVDADGMVVGIGAGSAIITGHWNTFTSTTRVTVVEVAFESVSAGPSHTCALTTFGATYCWGSNAYGESGRKPVVGFPWLTRPFPVPAKVAEGFTFVAITAGDSHTCALTAAGAAYCWGANGSGALGNGGLQDSWVPVPVSGGLTFATIKAGSGYTCGVDTGGIGYCWGYNFQGRLGSGGLTSSPVPVAVSGGLAFAELIASSLHTCGVTTDGRAFCWGENGIGELGIGPQFTTFSTPQPVSGGLTFTSITAGEAHTCGLTHNGSSYCWGSDYYDQLGTGADRVSSDVPAPVAGSFIFSTVAAGWSHTCALEAGGAAHCWGWNYQGQLGTGSVADELAATPQRVVGGFTFDRLTTGRAHNCARTTTGVWYCWGYNESGELGIGTTTNNGTPLKVLGQK